MVPRRVGRPTDPVPTRRSDGPADDSDAPRARTLLLRARPRGPAMPVSVPSPRTEARHPPRAEHTSARGVRKPSVRRVRVRPDVIGSRRVEQEPGDVGVTSTETRSSWSDRLSPRNWPLVWKLVAVGLVPALLALVLGVLRVADQAHTASQLDTANGCSRSATRSRRRGNAPCAWSATGRRCSSPSAGSATAGRCRTPSRRRTRADRHAPWRRPARRTSTRPRRTAFEQAEGGFAQLPVLRADVGGSAPVLPAGRQQRYTGVIARTDVLDRALLRQLRHPGGRRPQRRADGGDGAASEALALQHTVLGAALRAGTVTPDGPGGGQRHGQRLHRRVQPSTRSRCRPDADAGQLHRLARRTRSATPTRPPSSNAPEAGPDPGAPPRSGTTPQRAAADAGRRRGHGVPPRRSPPPATPPRPGRATSPASTRCSSCSACCSPPRSSCWWRGR